MFLKSQDMVRLYGWYINLSLKIKLSDITSLSVLLEKWNFYIHCSQYNGIAVWAFSVTYEICRILWDGKEKKCVKNHRQQLQ